MADSNLFEWLMYYQCRSNLEPCLRWIVDGTLRHPDGLDPFEEGEEADGIRNYVGLLIISDGRNLLDMLRQDKIVYEEDVAKAHDDDGFVKVTTAGELSDYLDMVGKRDGAYVYDGDDNEITRVYEFTNRHPNLERVPLLDFIPDNFFEYNGCTPPERKQIGTKTRLAIRLPQAYENIQTYQIKRTAYASLGMGKVTHFDNSGLREEFFLMHAPGLEGAPYISAEKGIIGVYRDYVQRDGKVVLNSQSLIRLTPDGIEKVPYELPAELGPTCLVNSK